jgi:hypothetical protein
MIPNKSGAVASKIQDDSWVYIPDKLQHECKEAGVPVIIKTLKTL